MQTKNGIIAVLAAIVVVGGGAWAWQSQQKSGEMMHDGSMTGAANDAMMHDDSMMASSSDSMMASSSDRMMASSSDSMHDEGSMMAH